MGRVIGVILAFDLLLAGGFMAVRLYEAYEGMRDLVRWKDAVLTQCEAKQRTLKEWRYRTGHVVKEVAPR